jgi:type VI secretion system protein ImpL
MKRIPWTRWPWRHAAALVLTAWAGGLAVAAVQLAAWNDELVRTLLQIRADTVFRTRSAQLNETIPREWYRSKALALLAAAEKLQDDGRWMLFLPGSWRPFDDLRDRLALRIEREFSEIAVDTMRRELYFRASSLTGVAQDARSGALQVAGGCAMPPSPAATGMAGMRELPEALALQSHLEALEQLDQAVGAMVALQDPATAEPAQLRVLVRYTLGAEVRGRLSRSASLFSGGLRPADPAATALGVAHLQQAVRCSVGKAMAALDARIFERNDLLAAETHLGQRAARLFAPGARPLPYAETVQALREIIAALDQQAALLAHGDYAWLHGAQPGLGPLHESLLDRVSSISLLGPDAAEPIRRRSLLAAQQFSKQFAHSLAGGREPALVWAPDRGRMALSPQRVALRDGLAGLLREPFMAEPAGRVLPASVPGPLGWDAQRLAQALSLGGERRRFATESLPRFPPSVRAGVAHVVHAQLAQRVQDHVVEAMIPAASGEAPLAFDAAAFRAQRELLGKVQGLLSQLGARDRADRLRGLLAHDLLERLALAEQALWRSPLFSARTQDFGWWQGEGAPLLQAFGAADTLTLKYLLAQQIAQMDESSRVAAVLLPYADVSIAASPSVVRWRGMAAAMDRWRAGTGGSVAALQRYLMGLAGQVTRANCTERLAAAGVADGGSDEFARRQAHLHRALQRRCAELRAAQRLPW